MLPTEDQGPDPEKLELAELLDYLDRLEELREDMTDLGVASIEEIEHRITSFSAKIDDRVQAGDSP